MDYIIVGIVSAVIGCCIGVAIMCALIVGKQADELLLTDEEQWDEK